MRRFISHLRGVAPSLTRELLARSFSEPDSSEVTRRVMPSTPVSPVDRDTSLSLLRVTDCANAPFPMLDADVVAAINTVLAENAAAEQLNRARLSPRRTLLFVGPPGTGKTMLASAMAGRLGLPLAQLELSAAVSSFLGRSGQNLREVLEYARTNHVVLLLDEFDAVAKRRDDQADLGELKRIVSVLLKELEEWPGPSLIIAATNHAELIDPAIFRRFQVCLSLGALDADRAASVLVSHLLPEVASPEVVSLGGVVLESESGSFIRDVAHDARRALVLAGVGYDRQRLAGRACQASDDNGSSEAVL